jgi:hypothetical protein
MLDQHRINERAKKFAEGIAVGRSLSVCDTDEDDVGFTQEVLNGLYPEIDEVGEACSDVISRFIQSCQRSGWTTEDVINYVRCWEEFNPDLDEDVALARMRAISDKYLGNMSKLVLYHCTKVKEYSNGPFHFSLNCKSVELSHES